MSTNYMSKEEVQANSLRSLSQIKSAGIDFVELLESGLPRATCKSARALKKKSIPIDLAAPLPLPGCDKEHCLCIYTAKL